MKWKDWNTGQPRSGRKFSIGNNSSEWRWIRSPQKLAKLIFDFSDTVHLWRKAEFSRKYSVFKKDVKYHCYRTAVKDCYSKVDLHMRVCWTLNVLVYMDMKKHIIYDQMFYSWYPFCYPYKCDLNPIEYVIHSLNLLVRKAFINHCMLRCKRLDACKK